MDELGVGAVHVLGNSIGARVALELAVRGRARSVVAISPSGMNIPGERLHQGALMATNRLALGALRPLIPAAARTTIGRSALLAGLRSMPWRSTEVEARALKEGFAEADAFWQMLWWGILADVPTGLDRIDCPVVLAQGTAAWSRRTDPQILGEPERGSCASVAGHPPSPTPRRHPAARRPVHRAA